MAIVGRDGNTVSGFSGKRVSVLSSRQQCSMRDTCACGKSFERAQMTVHKSTCSTWAAKLQEMFALRASRPARRLTEQRNALEKASLGQAELSSGMEAGPSTFEDDSMAVCYFCAACHALILILHRSTLLTWTATFLS